MKNKLTVENLDPALRMFGYQFDKKTIDNLINIFELVREKGNKVNLKDIAELQELHKIRDTVFTTSMESGLSTFEILKA
jgi:hypothetical protein